jgi:hypothetical protein
MLIEMRRYSVLPGRMGDMHIRMSTMLFPMFREAGVPMPAAIWENRDDTSVLTWMLEWPNFEERQAAWSRIAPVFAAARRAEGTEEFVTRTTLTLVAPWPGHELSFDSAGERLCETAWHVQPRIGFGAAFMAACEKGGFAHFLKAGATSVSAFNLLFGPLPQVIILATWPDIDARDKGSGSAAVGPAKCGGVAGGG